MDEIIAPNKLNIERIDRLISLCDSLPLPQPEPVDDLDIDLDKEQAFQDDLAKKTKYKLTLGKFLLKARDNMDNVDLSELLQSIVNNYILVLKNLECDEFSRHYFVFKEILTPCEDISRIEIKSEIDLDQRITMAPPKPSFVNTSFDSSDNELNRANSDGSDVPAALGGGTAGSKNHVPIDQF